MRQLARALDFTAVMPIAVCSMIYRRALGVGYLQGYKARAKINRTRSSANTEIARVGGHYAVQGHQGH